MIEASPAPPFDPPPRDARLADLLATYPSSVFSERLYRSIELMERYTIDLSIDILTQLRILGRLDDWRSPEELCELFGFRSQFKFALGWLLQRLVETGCIETRWNDGALAVPQFRLRSSLWFPELKRLRAIGLEIDSGNAPTLDLLDKAASLYPAVASGEQSGEQALFGAQGIPLWLNYFSNDNPTYAVNNWIGAIAACEHMREKGSFRILECGAGASSGSELLLRCLDEQSLLPRLERYLITEPNAFFLRRGQRDLSKRYSNLPLQWRALDMNQSWLDQSIQPGEFDLIYGVNVLHVAKDLLFTMAEARQTLAEKGWLVIGECVRPLSHQPIYVELIFQLLDSFIDVTTEPEIRPNPGFLTSDQWRQSFTESSFSRIEVVPNVNRVREIYPHFFTAAVCGQR
jgi:SAM-dependent methyltransferase